MCTHSDKLERGQTEVVVSRVDPGAWWIPAISLGLAAYTAADTLWTQTPTDAIGRMAGYGLAAVSLLLALAAVIWMRRAAIVAGPRGLRWRDMGGWRQVEWDGVLDYHQRAVDNSLPSAGTVETVRGNLYIQPHFTNLPALRAAIREQATRAPSRNWGVKGARPEDPWPREFVESPLWLLLTPAAAALILLPALLVMHIAATAFDLLTEFSRTGVPLPAHVQRMLLQFVLMSVVALLPALFLGIGMLINQYRYLRFAGDRIVATSDSLTLKPRKGNPVTIRWADVQDAGFRVLVPGQPLAREYTVYGAGSTIRFHACINRLKVLTATITAQSSALKQRPYWASTSGSAYIGGPQSFWSGPQPEMGQHIHHYHSKDTLAALLPLFAMFFLGLLVMLTVPPAQRPHLFPVVTGAFAALVLGYMIWRVRRAQVRTDERGISWHGHFGIRRFDWGDVTDVQALSSGTVVRAGARKIVFWKGISEYEELLREIQRRTGRSPAGLDGQTEREGAR